VRVARGMQLERDVQLLFGAKDAGHDGQVDLVRPSEGASLLGSELDDDEENELVGTVQVERFARKETRSAGPRMIFLSSAVAFIVIFVPLVVFVVDCFQAVVSYWTAQCEAPLKWFLLVTALAASLALGALSLISATAVRTFVVRGYDGRMAFQLARAAGVVMGLYLALMSIWSILGWHWYGALGSSTFQCPEELTIQTRTVIYLHLSVGLCVGVITGCSYGVSWVYRRCDGVECRWCFGSGPSGLGWCCQVSCDKIAVAGAVLCAAAAVCGLGFGLYVAFRSVTL